MVTMFKAKFGHCPKKSSARRWLQTCRLVEKEWLVSVTKIAEEKLKRNFGTLVTPKMIDIEAHKQLQRHREQIIREARVRFDAV